MTRKSKQTGGHNPLTHYEMTKKFKSSAYGTSTVRLSTDAQGNFGDCALSLTPAVDPVATPSGHVYSREAIVEYLLTKTNDIKKAKQNYQAYLEKQRTQQEKESADARSQAIVEFEAKQKAAPVRKRAREEDNVLARTSYWLSEFQPEWNETMPAPPPDRPASPNSGQPLRLKDLQPLSLERSEDGKVICAVSHKTITTQPVVAMKEHVVLEDVYDKLVKPTMICPITGTKLKAKNIRRLQKGKSGFASSGSVEAKTYRPTIT